MTLPDLDIMTSDTSDFAPDGAILTVDLDAVIANYRQLRDIATGAETSCVVKANAYGLGLKALAYTFWNEGCRTFFIAKPNEGIELRRLLPEADIYVLDGLLPGRGGIYAEHRLLPCLSSLEEIEEWSLLAKAGNRDLPAALHFDTGINRLGISARETETIIAHRNLLSGIEVKLVMSHLACAGDVGHPLNALQLSRFRTIRAAFPGVRASLANSAGVLLGRDYHFDLTRPGIGLYGGNPLTGQKNPFHHVIKAEARVLQLRELSPGETVGYGASWTAREVARIAVLAVGYGDGYFRALSSRPTGLDGGRVYLAGHYAPIAGRISMDTLCVDITALPEGSVTRGDLVELIGPHVTADEVGLRAGSFAYEVLTGLGERYKRLYSAGGRIMPDTRGAAPGVLGAIAPDRGDRN